MHRFFVPLESIADDTVTLPPGVARQLDRVLRARPGDRIVALDNAGWEYTVVLEEVGRHGAVGSVVGRSPAGGEPAVGITLYQAVLKADRFDLVLQKCTELGVSRFVPTFCERSVPQQRDRGWTDKRHTRWTRIITEAAEQSRRGRVPALDGPIEFAAACESVAGLALIPWEQHEATGLRAALAPGTKGVPRGPSVSVFIGPEGGFTEEEVAAAAASGITPVTLGERILRAETAGIATVATVLYELGG